MTETNWDIREYRNQYKTIKVVLKWALKENEEWDKSKIVDGSQHSWKETLRR